MLLRSRTLYTHCSQLIPTTAFGHLATPDAFKHAAALEQDPPTNRRGPSPPIDGVGVFEREPISPPSAGTKSYATNEWDFDIPRDNRFHNPIAGALGKSYSANLARLFELRDKFHTGKFLSQQETTEFDELLYGLHGRAKPALESQENTSARSFREFDDLYVFADPPRTAEPKLYGEKRPWSPNVIQKILKILKSESW